MRRVVIRRRGRFRAIDWLVNRPVNGRFGPQVWQIVARGVAVGRIDGRDVGAGQSVGRRILAVKIVLPAPAVEFILMVEGAVHSPVQLPEVVDAFRKGHAVVSVVTGVCRVAAGPRSGGWHQIRLIHGREEILRGNFHVVHHKGRQILLVIFAVKILQAYLRAVGKIDYKVVAVPQKGCVGRGKFENKTRPRLAWNILANPGLRFCYPDIRHLLLLLPEKP